MSSTFTPSPTELALVNQIFAQADPQKLGVLTGEVAVRVFGGANLSPTVLGEIWSIADEDNNGWLPRKGVAIAVRLMGWAQKGEKISGALVNKPGPLPNIEGVAVPVAQHNTGISLSKSPPPGDRLPPFTPQDKAKFLRYFTSSNPVNGLLTGEKARDIFVKSKLPIEKLQEIWNLADTQDRGALDSTDFAIGMYLIQASMHGQLPFIPKTLPPGLYEQAAGITTHNTGGSGSRISLRTTAFPPAAPARPLQQLYTGQSSQRPPSDSVSPRLPARPSALSTVTSSLQPLRTSAWDVTAEEKANADLHFDRLDSQKKGYIEGDAAVPFMLESKLDGEVLAQVWDLADINNDGRLTRDGFAVAIHLIKGKLASKDLPSSLPPSLVPPSMRINANQINGSPFAPPALQEPQRDLLGDDTPPSSATAPQPAGATVGVVMKQLTGGVQDVFAPATSPSRTKAHPDPFGSGDFGSGAFVSTSPSNLMDDDDTGTTSAPLHDQSAEIGNVQNQLHSTNRSLNTSKTERANVEQTLANQAAQLSALQTQLSSAKAAYETETKLLTTLRERYSYQVADIQKTREELIRAESDLSAIRVEKAEVEGAFLRDKEEARDLHRKMVEAGIQAEQMKAGVEKARKDAKQQKGLLAIARKQLSTKEAEKARMAMALDEANRETTEATTARIQVEAEVVKEEPSIASNGAATGGVERSDSADLLLAAGHPLPISPDSSSPSGTISPGGSKSNNPFERLNAASTPRSQSPFLPFANNPTPTSPEHVSDGPAIGPETSQDPFGLSQAVEQEQPAVAPEQDADGSLLTPRPSFHEVAIPSALHEGPTSPGSAVTESEDFSTPPMTATSPSNSQSPVENLDAAPQFPDVETTTSQFPALDSTPNVPGHFGFDDPPAGHGETDLHAQLKEVEVDDSDSDSDDEDQQPLSVLAAKKQGTLVTSTINGNLSAPSFENVFDAPDKKQSTPVMDATSTEPTSFENIFDAPAKAPSPIPSGTPSQPARFGAAESPGAFVAAATVITSPSSGAVDFAKSIAGVNEFDEAMGKIPNTNAAPQLTFESAFEDNFDFASASGPVEITPIPASPSAFPPAPANVNGKSPRKSTPFDSAFPAPSFPLPSSNGASSNPPTQDRRPFSFVDAFGPAPIEASTAQETQPPSPSGQHIQSISFDEAFSGIGGPRALHLDSAFNSPTFQTSASSQRTEETKQPSSGSPVTKNRPSSPLVSSIRSVSPPPTSPYSPKGRASTSSSKEGHEKPKEPTRHSKLSIRLPFGKRKKHETPPVAQPSYQQYLSPVEEPAGAFTPAVDDDVDAVKQLCSMGFSRTQAVIALEKHGYDVSKALNSLLGQQ